VNKFIAGIPSVSQSIVPPRSEPSMVKPNIALAAAVLECLGAAADDKPKQVQLDEGITLSAAQINPTHGQMLFTDNGVVAVVADKQYQGTDTLVLNLDGRHFFSWALLYSFWSRADNGPSTYRAFWIEQLLRYLRLSTRSYARLLNKRKLFQEACICFVRLMRIVYRRMLCECLGKKGIVVDGTQLEPSLATGGSPKVEHGSFSGAVDRGT
jgi:hypothetical protein